MRVLALSSWWPEPADNGSRLRIANLLRAMGGVHEVHFLALAQERVEHEQVERLRRVCASARVVRQRPARIRPLDRLRSLGRPEPASVIAGWDPVFAALVQQQATTIRPELVIAFQPGVAPYARLVRGAPRLLEELELTYLFEQYNGQRRPGRRLRYWLTWRKHASYVRQLLQDFDACTVVSEGERARALRLAPRGMPVICLPNGADLEGCGGPWGEPEPDTLIYPGALSYEPNYDAVAYFLEAVMPLIAHERPAVRLRVTGKDEARRRATLPAHRGVEFTGYMPDVRPAVARAWAEVVPLRLGGGTRLKVLEALALGTPVVSTSKGIEGLELEHERHVLVADTAAEFAAATVRLLEQPELREHLAAAGRRVVQERYSWSQLGQRLAELMDELARRDRRSVAAPKY